MGEVKEKLAACTAKRKELAAALTACEDARAELAVKLKACLDAKATLADSVRRCHENLAGIRKKLQECLDTKVVLQEKIEACHKARDAAQAKWDKCEEQKKTLNAAIAKLEAELGSFSSASLLQEDQEARAVKEAEISRHQARVAEVQADYAEARKALSEYEVEVEELLAKEQSLDQDMLRHLADIEASEAESDGLRAQLDEQVAQMASILESLSGEDEKAADLVASLTELGGRY